MDAPEVEPVGVVTAVLVSVLVPCPAEAVAEEEEEAPVGPAEVVLLEAGKGVPVAVLEPVEAGELDEALDEALVLFVVSVKPLFARLKREVYW